MLLNKIKNKIKNFFHFNPQRLSTRITISYLVLFIIVIFIFDMLVIFFTEQFLLANNQRQIVKNRDFIVKLCEDYKGDILKLPPAERLPSIFHYITFRNSEFEYSNFYLYLSDNHGDTYQPLKDILNFEDYNFKFDFKISNTIFLFEHKKNPENVQFLMDSKDQFLYLFTVIKFNKDYNVEISLMKNINDSVKFIQNLTTVLIIVNIIGFLLLLFVGKFTTKRALKPLANIGDIAKNINIKSLNERIPEYNTDDELDILIKALNQMIGRLETSFTLQNRFVSDASHELRIPLTVIQGYIDILDSWGVKDEEILTESITAIKQETYNMHTLVDKLLFLARIENNRLKMNFKTFNANELLQRVYSDFKIISPTHEFIIEHNDICQMYADENLILQVLRATIENSIKYTDDGGKIILSLNDFDNRIEIKIKDTGIGIPEDELPKICNRFYRVDTSRTKQTGGTGLGLSIVKSIIKLHDSYMNIKSKYGEGTEVTFIFTKKSVKHH